VQSGSYYDMKLKAGEGAGNRFRVAKRNGQKKQELRIKKGGQCPPRNKNWQ